MNKHVVPIMPLRLLLHNLRQPLGPTQSTNFATFKATCERLLENIQLKRPFNYPWMGCPAVVGRQQLGDWDNIRRRKVYLLSKTNLKALSKQCSKLFVYLFEPSQFRRLDHLHMISTSRCKPHHQYNCSLYRLRFHSIQLLKI